MAQRLSKLHQTSANFPVQKLKQKKVVRSWFLPERSDAASTTSDASSSRRQSNPPQKRSGKVGLASSFKEI